MENEKEKLNDFVRNESNRKGVVNAIDLINEVMNEPDPVYLWKGIPEGSKGLIAGVSKTGKTTFAENLAISMCLGRKDFFGYEMDEKPRKILYVYMEESYKLRSRRLKKQISILNEREKQLFAENYKTTDIDFPQFLNSDDDWQKLRENIINSKAQVVFLDSLSHMCIGEIERSSVAQNFIQTFRRFLENLQVTLIVIHHNTKGNEKPIEQDSIAGSRIILQEFEYALGMANSPYGGNYSCMLFNKYIENDSTTAHTYKINENSWVEKITTTNKFTLYKENRVDYRTDSTNADLILKYISSQTSQTSRPISTNILYEKFVSGSTKIMSKDTLHQNLNKLNDAQKIISPTKGEYKLKNVEENGK